jgi:putative PIN family toxin of toxin-antitoxin system
MTIRAVLDTNILVAGLSSQRGASFVLLTHALNRRFELVASPALWLEYEAVLKRREIMTLHGLTANDVDEILNALAQVVTPVQSHFLWRPQQRDPNDEMVLEAAVNGQTGYLVTLNVRDFDMATTRWQIKLMAPGPFLRLLENTS